MKPRQEGPAMWRLIHPSMPDPAILRSGIERIVVTIFQPVFQMRPLIGLGAGRKLRVSFADSDRLAIEARLAIDTGIGGAAAKGQTGQHNDEDVSHAHLPLAPPWRHLSLMNS